MMKIDRRTAMQTTLAAAAMPLLPTLPTCRDDEETIIVRRLRWILSRHNPQDKMISFDVSWQEMSLDEATPLRLGDQVEFRYAKHANLFVVNGKGSANALGSFKFV